MKKIKKILIANRGEIAIRICKTLKQLNINAVLIYSEMDRESYYLNFADEKHFLKGETLSETYLSIEQIIKVAKNSNCNAIHPGYGFLSENPDFANAVENNGLLFIGPSSETIKKMGNKITARNIAEKVNVPVIPIVKGSQTELLDSSKNFEFPILIKAAAGGGGKGMRIVYNYSQLQSDLKSCSREALSAFGNGEIYIEKFFSKARHIEVQILGDKFDNLIHLYERECSIQRRYQKIIEESPAIILNEKLKNEICQAAVNIAKEIKYFSAGTIEFLLDENENFYFLEMNTRIQVEHPVTEMVTGIDIVKEQIKIAEGKKLSYAQNEIKQIGHAIECRIYAEDPSNDFIPSPGNILLYIPPTTNDIIRLDSSVNSPTEISSSFDPMISKLICFGNDRDESIKNCIEALENYKIIGIKNNIRFLRNVLLDEKYCENKIHTKYCEEEFEKLLNQSTEKLSKEVKLISLIALLCHIYLNEKKAVNLWEKIGRWRELNTLNVNINEEESVLEIHSYSSNEIKFTLSNENYHCTEIKQSKGKIMFNLNDEVYETFFVKNGNKHFVLWNNNEIEVTRNDILTEILSVGIDKVNDDDKFIYPVMPGKVIDVFVSEGDQIKKGNNLVILEAMKMETVIKAPHDCKIEKIYCEIGDIVKTENPLLIIGVI